VKKVQQSVRVTSKFVGDAKSILDYKADLDQFVREGLITQAVADRKLRERMDMVGNQVEEVCLLLGQHT
jgi:hypothetical protein